MRILVLIHEYPPVGGGGGRVAEDLCCGFAAAGHEVQVLTAWCAGLPYQEEAAGGRVRIRRLVSGRRWPYRADLRAMAGFVWAAFWAGWQTIRRWKPDVIHVHFAVPAGPVAWALHLVSGVPYVMTVHLGDVRGGVPEKTDKWFRWIFPFTPPVWRGAARVAAVSEHTRQLAQRDYDVPVQVIPNGVDLNLLQPGALAVNDPPQVVFAGRFMPQKNPVELVRILGRVQDLPWRCAMLGDGPLRAEVEAEIARLGLGERFDLPGWLKPEEVIERYRHSDLMFMPSLSEGLPVVGVQAMAMGLALVLSRVGGCVDLVQPGENGALLAPEDADGFERALRELLGDRQRLYAARCASRRLAQRFDLNTVVESYHQIFSQVVKT